MSTSRRSQSRFAELAMTAALATSWLAPPALAQSGARPSARDFAPERLAALPTASWPTNGGNLYNQRYSPLTQIDRSNVAQLKGVWRARLDGSGVGSQYSGEAQPVVYDGAAYLITGADDVFAISVDSGATLWKYSANLDPGITSVCCGWTSRGVGLSADKVFVGRLDARLVALDRETGKPVWDVVAERWEDNFSITSAPLYYDGMVIVGFAGADRGTRGRVKAFDARDGGLLWTFYTIPGSASSTSRRATRGPTTTAAVAPATISTPCRSSRSRRGPAATAGISNRCITTSGTTTRATRSC
jgi:glucose dehydrogenase